MVFGNYHFPGKDVLEEIKVLLNKTCEIQNDLEDYDSNPRRQSGTNFT